MKKFNPKDNLNDNNLNEEVMIPYFIAEAGVNHEGSLENAFRLIDDAKEGGADAIKFQTYKAEKIASKFSPSYWDLNFEPTKSQYELFKKYDTFSNDDYEALKLRCDQVGIEFMSTPFDFDSAIFLNDLVNIFKISSSDITNRPFIELIDSFKKPLILSTGASSIKEVQAAVSWLSEDVNLILLHCILNYPTTNDNANLGMVLDLKNKFRVPIGYSDHTLPGEMTNLIYAILLGVVVIEKHFTFDKTLPGNDHYHSCDKNDLKLYQENLMQLKALLGSFKKEFLESEKISRQNARRSIVALKDLEAGETIRYEDFTFKRPGTGIPPYKFNDILGKRLKNRVQEDQLIADSDILEKD